MNFRDSKLTRILQPSLCSNSKSAVICTVFPTYVNLQETLNTLKFGSNASRVKISSKSNSLQDEDRGITPKGKTYVRLENPPVIHEKLEEQKHYNDLKEELERKNATIQAFREKNDLLCC